jgi:hypothetical protein
VEAAQEQKNLSTQQEEELVKYIKDLTSKGLPPTRAMIQNFTSVVAKKEVGKSWVLRCNDAGKTRDPNLAWSHSEAYGSAWENRNLGSIDTYRSCTKGLQKTAYLHLGDCNVKYTKAMKC